MLVQSKRRSSVLRTVHLVPAHTVILTKQLLGLPHVVLLADRKLEILSGRHIPELVDHHNSKQVSDGGKECTVNVVLDLFADDGRNGIEKDLRSHKEKGSKGNSSNHPDILQNENGQSKLRQDVDHHKNEVEEVEHHKETHGVMRANGVRAPRGNKGEERNDKGEDEGTQSGSSQEEHGSSGTVFVELEAKETKVHQGPQGGGNSTILDSHEVGEGSRARRSHSGVNHQRHAGKEEEAAQKVEQLFSANRRVLALDCVHHDENHGQGSNVDEGVADLENDGVGQLDGPRVTLRHEANAVEKRRLVTSGLLVGAYQHAQRQG